MQYFSFKDFFISLLFLFGTCQTSEPVPATSTIQLPESRNEVQNDYEDVSTKFTLILIDNQKIYAYEGKDINNATYHNYGKVRKLVHDSKKKFPEKEFVVIIKTTPQTSYKETVEILDEMKINGIKRYTINELSSEEKEKLHLN